MPATLLSGCSIESLKLQKDQTGFHACFGEDDADTPRRRQAATKAGNEIVHSYKRTARRAARDPAPRVVDALDLTRSTGRASLRTSTPSLTIPTRGMNNEGNDRGGRRQDARRIDCLNALF
ncbi:hypothetical protein AB7M63_006518 [Bradyrhizobium japonicum]